MMKIYMIQGWKLAAKHFYLILLFFLYQLIWGFFLYRYIDSIVAPLLRRFPGTTASDQAVQTFMVEAQFQLFKTDLISPYLWLLGSVLAVRMLLTPLFQSGLLYSLHHQSKDGSGTRFLEGIRKVWKPVMLLYWLEALLTMAPAWWLMPRAWQSLMGSSSIPGLLMNVLPGAGLWLLWGSAIHLLFLSMQFGAASGDGIFRSLWYSVKHFVSYAAISIIMWAISAAIGLAVTGLSLLWAGLFALIVHQGFHFIRSLLRVWTLAAQYHCLHSK